MDAIDEQAEIEKEAITSDENLGIDGIFDEALEGKDASQTEGAKSGAKGTEQVVNDTPFLELVLSDAEKRAFKTEEEFQKFLESNKVLKDGWMRQSDYTRKAQEFSKQQKEIENQKNEELKAWGKIAPDAASKQALATLWQVYQNNPDPEIQAQISNFVKDVQLLARGQQPTGPLKSVQGASNVSPEVSALQKQIHGLEQKLQGFQGSIQQREQQALQAEQARIAQEADKTINEWVTTKEKSGVKIQQDEFGVMADLMSITDEKGEPKYTLDQAYNLARTHLGRAGVDAVRSVVKTAKQLNQSTSRTPISRASASKDPEPKGIGEIFEQGIKNLSK